MRVVAKIGTSSITDGLGVIDAAVIAVPAVPAEGAATDNVGDAAATTVLVMLALLQRLLAALLLLSAGEETYHQ